MTELLSSLSGLLQAHQSPASKLVLALSGGLDSRLLLHTLFEYRQQHPDTVIEVVHVHHGLSVHADHWARECQRWCHEYQLTLHIEYAALDLDSNQSLEAQAREARYGLLARHLAPHDLLLTAQHADDQLETLLLALKRGSGPAGLAAMGEVSDFNGAYLLRPFLGFTRQYLEQCAAQLQLEWVEDESNQNQDFDRNFLRHEIVPKLAQRWPHIQAAAVRSAGLCYEQQSLLQSLIDEKYQTLVDLNQSLDCQQLIGYESALQNQLLRMWLKQLKQVMPSQKQLRLIVTEVMGAKSDANPKLVLGENSVHRYQNRLYLVANCAVNKQWSQPLGFGEAMPLPCRLGTVELTHTDDRGMQLRSPLKNELVSVVFLDSVKGAILHPEGRLGSRKLKKLFQEYQIPPWKRTFIPILMYNQQVVAVGNLFVCKEFFRR